jgi:hypothetical protein
MALFDVLRRIDPAVWSVFVQYAMNAHWLHEVFGGC